MESIMRNIDTTDPMEYIKALSRNVAIRILVNLCNDNNLAERIIAMAKASLSDVDADDFLYDWKKDNTVDDIKEVQAVYDNYFSDEDSESSISEH